MAGWSGERRGEGGDPSTEGGVDPRVGSDHHGDPRGCDAAHGGVEVIFGVERRAPHMVRPRSAFLVLQALGVGR
jgi:hypothetical protein